MPFTYVIDPQRSLTWETWSGEVDVDELYDSCRQEWRDPAYRTGMNMLSDFRAAQLNITFEEMRDFAAYMGREESVKRHAIVVSRTVGYGLARMFAGLSESTSPYWDSLRVYFDFAEAQLWIAEHCLTTTANSRSPSA